MLLPGLYEHRPDYYHKRLERVSLELHIRDRQEMLHAKHNLDDKCLSPKSSPFVNEVRKGMRFEHISRRTEVSHLFVQIRSLLSYCASPFPLQVPSQSTVEGADEFRMHSGDTSSFFGCLRVLGVLDRDYQESGPGLRHGYPEPVDS
jgi:hypothetical protein